MFDFIFLKFIGVGIINTLFSGILIFTLYNAAGMGYWLSSAMGYVFGTITSFFLNKYFTFGEKEWSLFMVAAFIINTALCYVTAYGIAKPLMNYFLQGNTKKFRENAALFTGMCLFTGLNYLGQRFVVFRHKDRR